MSQLFSGKDKCPQSCDDWGQGPVRVGLVGDGLKVLPVEVGAVFAHVDFEVFRGFGYVLDCAEDGVSDVGVCQVFPEMVVSLKNKGYVLFSKKVDK